ncbi:MAG: hypothetical protein V1652_03325 [bacterium]
MEEAKVQSVDKTVDDIQKQGKNGTIKKAKESGYSMIRRVFVSPYVLGALIPVLITIYLVSNWNECNTGTIFSALCYVNFASTVSVVWGLYFLTVLMFFIVDLFFDKKDVYKSEKFVKFIVLIVCALLVYGTASILSLWIFFTEQLQKV